MSQIKKGDTVYCVEAETGKPVKEGFVLYPPSLGMFFYIQIGARERGFNRNQLFHGRGDAEAARLVKIRAAIERAKKQIQKWEGML